MDYDKIYIKHPIDGQGCDFENKSFEYYQTGKGNGAQLFIKWDVQNWAVIDTYAISSSCDGGETWQNLALCRGGERSAHIAIFKTGKHLIKIVGTCNGKVLDFDFVKVFIYGYDETGGE